LGGSQVLPACRCKPCGPGGTPASFRTSRPPDFEDRTAAVPIFRPSRLITVVLAEDGTTCGGLELPPQAIAKPSGVRRGPTSQGLKITPRFISRCLQGNKRRCERHSMLVLRVRIYRVEWGSGRA